MWHTIERQSADLPLKSTITSFVPQDENVEVMLVTLENLSDADQTLTAYGAIPIFGRIADNIRDHRNVTSMLHRIKTTDEGVLVCQPCHLMNAVTNSITKFTTCLALMTRKKHLKHSIQP